MSILCALPLAAKLFAACAPPTPLAVGYVEGEFIMLAPVETAQVEQIQVRRGDRIAAGSVIATIDAREAQISVAQGRASLEQAQAQLANLKLGRRPQEIAVLEANLRSAQAQADEAKRVMTRSRDLLARGTASQAQFDEAATSLKVAEAAVGQAEANLQVGRLPARDEEIRAAEAQMAVAQSNLDQAQWRLDQRILKAPNAGRVQDVIRHPGDLAGPSAPVAQLLPDGATKLTLFLPQEHVAQIRPGDRLDIRCDGCSAGLQAEISYIASDPEFTPPVIFSLETRQKLVFLVEAKPLDKAKNLNPGQIVDVFRKPADD